MRSIQYRPEIDGLRAIAVLPVILFHLGLPWIPGGFVGVDVFFVISGYLISSIIIKEQQEDRFSFASFWTRRARRILPVLLIVTFATLVAGFLFGYRNDYSSQGVQALSALFSLANIYMWQSTGDYWGPKAETMPFLHCWSLSVEEQFYLAYPLLLVGLLQASKKLALSAVFLLVLGSLTLFAYFSTRIPSAVFYLLPFRIWELGAGCILTLVGVRMTAHQGRWYSHALAGLGLALICASYFLFPSGSLRFKLLVPVLGAALFVGFSQSKRGVGRLLSFPPIVYIGNISYSLYVWHWPVIVLAREKDPTITSHPIGLALLFGLIFFLSILSYHYIESPLRHSQRTLKLLPYGFAACLLAAGFGNVAVNSRGDAYDTSAFNQVSYPMAEFDIRPDITMLPSEKKKMSGVNIGRRLPGQEEAFANDGIIRRYGKETPDVMVLGDSHAIMWAKVIDDVCREHGLTISYFASAANSPFIKLPLTSKQGQVVGFTPEQKRRFDERRLACIKNWKPLVILCVRWMSYNSDDVLDLVEYIGNCGCKLILVEQPPEIDIGDRNSAQYLVYRGYSPSATGQRQTFPQSNIGKEARARKFIRQLEKQYPFCQVLETYDKYAADANNAYVIDGRDILYLDDDHLTTAGASKVRERFEQILPTANEKSRQILSSRSK